MLLLVSENHLMAKESHLIEIENLSTEKRDLSTDLSDLKQKNTLQSQDAKEVEKTKEFA